MITYEQRVKYDAQTRICLQWAKLDRDYQAKYLDYILPAGTIVQVDLDDTFLGVLFVDGEMVDFHFPYDAATLLETKNDY